MLAGVDWTAAGVFVAAAAAFIAVLALWVPMRALSRQLRSANYQQIVAMFCDFSKLIVDNPELEPLIYGTPYQAASEPNLGKKVDWAIGIRFGWFESVIVQRNRYGLLSSDVADHWCGILKKELDSPAMRRHWDKYQSYYHPDLREEVEKLLDGKD